MVVKLFPSIRPVIHPVQLKVFCDSPSSFCCNSNLLLLQSIETTSLPILLLLQQQSPSSLEHRSSIPSPSISNVASIFPSSPSEWVPKTCGSVWTWLDIVVVFHEVFSRDPSIHPSVHPVIHPWMAPYKEENPSKNK